MFAVETAGLRISDVNRNGRRMAECKARAGYRIVRCRLGDGGSIVCDEKAFHTGAIIAQAMEGASKLALFTVTLGAGYEEWMERIREEGDIVKEFVADAVASICTDGVTEDLLSRLRTACAIAGLRITNNYSPGYCSWALKEQRLLFSFIPEGMSGIRLTEECMMVPAKSVSGIVGIGKEAERRPYGCAVCTMRGRCRVQS
ncbi:MAG: hypothetical protein K6B45_02060 [Bacteroidaceae bacterium]|nr:hypothetical protein [Bacteroidaceae bacterium]